MSHLPQRPVFKVTLNHQMESQVGSSLACFAPIVGKDIIGLMNVSLRQTNDGHLPSGQVGNRRVPPQATQQVYRALETSSMTLFSEE